MTDINNIINITTGLTYKNEVCVINTICPYDFEIHKPNQLRCVEKPSYPPLSPTVKSLRQEGTCWQIRNNKQNIYELIPHNRYKQVKELMGYVGLKLAEYDLYKINEKETEYGETFINCGSNTPITINGITYQADQSTYGLSKEVSNPINGTKHLTKIYQTARYGRNLNWSITTKDNGMYKVLLRFADFWDRYRITDIIINNTQRMSRLNIIGITKKPFVRYDVNFRVPSTQNNITIKLQNSSIINAIDVYRLINDDIEILNIDRDHIIENKDTYLFVRKQLNVSMHTIKSKFLNIRNSILRSRNKFFQP